MAAQEIRDALEKIAQAWHVLDRTAEAIAPAAAELTPLAAKIMGLAAAGTPLTAASEAALSILVDVFKAAEHNQAPASLPIEKQAAAAVAAPQASGAPFFESATTTETAPTAAS